jgi:hypothetical protein
MNRTILRNLIVALPMAAAAITMAPGAAMADDGPIIVLPTPDPGPQGPGDLTAPQPCPTHGGGEECEPDGDEPEIDVQSGGGLHPKAESIPVPTRIDAGVAPQSDGGLELSWLLAGGGLVTASGAAFAARRIRSNA